MQYWLIYNTGIFLVNITGTGTQTMKMVQKKKNKVVIGTPWGGGLAYISGRFLKRQIPGDRKTQNHGSKRQIVVGKAGLPKARRYFGNPAFL